MCDQVMCCGVHTCLDTARVDWHFKKKLNNFFFSCSRSTVLPCLSMIVLNFFTLIKFKNIIYLTLLTLSLYVNNGVKCYWHIINGVKFYINIITNNYNLQYHHHYCNRFKMEKRTLFRTEGKINTECVKYNLWVE